MSKTKAWDWSRNTDSQWLVPCGDSAYLSERWAGKGFTRFYDLGCGLGRHAIYMASRGFAVTATDLSPQGVEYLGDWARRERLTVDARICDMLDLPFADSSFDCAMAFNVLYHTDTAGVARALGELRRVLRPGGEAFITFISKHSKLFMQAGDDRRLDNNTILRNEDEAGEDVPHFHADLKDIQQLMAGWRHAINPREEWVYDLARPGAYSVHWKLLLIKE